MINKEALDKQNNSPAFNKESKKKTALERTNDAEAVLREIVY